MKVLDEQYYYPSTATYYGGEVVYFCGDCNGARGTMSAFAHIVHESSGAPVGATCCMCNGAARMWTLSERMAKRYRARP